MQLSLKIADPRYKRPLMAVESAKGILDLTEDQILHLADLGAAWAFDISTPRAARPELRFLTKSIAALGPDRARQILEADTPFDLQPPTLEDAITLILPKHTKPIITGQEIKRALNCGRTHLINLIDAKLLPQQPGTTYRPGRGGYPIIPRKEFAAFLQSAHKRLTGL